MPPGGTRFSGFCSGLQLVFPSPSLQPHLLYSLTCHGPGHPGAPRRAVAHVLPQRWEPSAPHCLWWEWWSAVGCSPTSGLLAARLGANPSWRARGGPSALPSSVRNQWLTRHRGDRGEVSETLLSPCFGADWQAQPEEHRALQGSRGPFRARLREVLSSCKHDPPPPKPLGFHAGCKGPGCEHHVSTLHRQEPSTGPSKL